MFKTIAFALGLALAAAAGPVAAQSLKQIDCSAVKKQANGLYLVLRDTSIVDASDNTFHLSKGLTIGPKSMISNGASIFDLIDKACPAAAAAPSSLSAAAGAGLYVYVDGGSPGGPLSAADLSAKLAVGALAPDTPVWTSALPRWTAAKDVAALGVAAAAASAPAAGPADCSGAGAAIYDDRFVDDSGGFPLSLGVVGAVKGALQINLSPQRENWAAINGKRTQTDGDYCVEAALPATSGDEVVSAGLAVLATDANSFYLGQISSNGHIGLYRRLNGKWSDLFATDEPASALNPPDGAANAIRIVVASGQLTLYVNGVRIGETQAEAPATPRFGVYAQVDGDRLPPDIAVRFRRFRVAPP